MIKTGNAERSTDQLTVLLCSIGILSISLFAQQSLASSQYLSFLIGVGLGITLLHAAFGFSGGWRVFIRERNSSGLRAQLLLIALTSMLVLPLAG